MKQDIHNLASALETWPTRGV